MRGPWRVPIWALLLAAVVAGSTFVGTALADLSAPPTAFPIATPAPASGAVPQPMLVITGRGKVQADRALAVASTQLPFAPLLPTAELGAMELAQVQAIATSATTALLDVVYLDRSGVQLHIFEANYPNEKPTIAVVNASEALTLDGRRWRYMLLEDPQPAGASYFVHFLDRPFDGALYVSIGLHSRGDFASERQRLFAIASSLR